MKGKGFGQLKKRLIASVLSAVLAVTVLPASVFADDDATASRRAWDILAGQKTVSEGKAQTATYILEVSTGTNTGAATADNIMYFGVYYTDVNGKKHTELIMPGIDAIERGYETAATAGNRLLRIRNTQNVFGYSIPDLKTNKAMGSVQTDQFLFTAPAKVANSAGFMSMNVTSDILLYMYLQSFSATACFKTVQPQNTAATANVKINNFFFISCVFLFHAKTLQSYCFFFNYARVEPFFRNFSCICQKKVVPLQPKYE